MASFLPLTKQGSSSSSGLNPTLSPTKKLERKLSGTPENIVKIYYCADKAATEIVQHTEYKSVQVLPGMTASDVRNKIAKKLLFPDGQAQKYALMMVDRVPTGKRQRRRARTLSKGEFPAELRRKRLASFLSLQGESKKPAGASVATEQLPAEHVRFILKNLGSPLNLDATYCGSSADEEEDDVEEPFLLPRTVENATLRGYLYKRGGRDELVWYKRWCVLYDGMLFYWKSQTSERDPVSISLSNSVIRVSKLATVNRHMRFAFELETPRRVFHFRAMTESHFTVWMKRLKAGVMFAEEDSQMQLAEYFIKDHEKLTSRTDIARIDKVSSDLREMLANQHSFECLVDFMRTYNKEELVMFWVDVNAFSTRTAAMFTEFQASERNEGNQEWRGAVQESWSYAYSIYEQYIDGETLFDVFNKQPELARVALDVHHEPPRADMFSVVQDEVFQLIREEGFEPFRKSDTFLTVLSAALLEERNLSAGMVN
eukprot:g5822.t1